MEYAAFHRVTNNAFLNSKIKSITLDEGEPLYREDAKINGVYFLVKGEMSMVKKKVVMFRVVENDFIGLVPFFLKENHNGYLIVAIKKTILIRIDFKTFNLAIERSKYLRKLVTDSFCKNRNDVLEKINFRAIKSSKKRIIFFIKSKIPQQNEGKVVFLVNKSIAKEIGVKESYLTKYLKELTSKRIINYINNCIEVIDSRGLDLLMGMNI